MLNPLIVQLAEFAQFPRKVIKPALYPNFEHLRIWQMLRCSKKSPPAREAHTAQSRTPFPAISEIVPPIARPRYRGLPRQKRRHRTYRRHLFRHPPPLMPTIPTRLIRPMPKPLEKQRSQPLSPHHRSLCRRSLPGRQNLHRYPP